MGATSNSMVPSASSSAARRACVPLRSHTASRPRNGAALTSPSRPAPSTIHAPEVPATATGAGGRLGLRLCLCRCRCLCLHGRHRRRDDVTERRPEGQRGRGDTRHDEDTRDVVCRPARAERGDDVRHGASSTRPGRAGAPRGETAGAVVAPEAHNQPRSGQGTAIDVADARTLLGPLCTPRTDTARWWPWWRGTLRAATAIGRTRRAA